MQTLANKSLKTSWIGLDIVNYSGYDHLALFKGNSEKIQVKLESEGRVLVGIDSNSQDLRYLFEALQERYNIPTEKIQLLSTQIIGSFYILMLGFSILYKYILKIIQFS